MAVPVVLNLSRLKLSKMAIKKDDLMNKVEYNITVYNLKKKCNLFLAFITTI